MSMTLLARRRSPARDYAPRSLQAGVMLIEALVAVIVFSIGILALIGLQAVAMKEVATAKMRSDASYIADRIVGDLSSVDLTAAGLQARLNFFVGDYTAAAVPAGLGGSPEAAADANRARSWQELISRSLPNGRVTIQVIAGAAGAPPNIALFVSWESSTGSITAATGSPCWIAADIAPRSCFTQAAVISD